MNHKIAKAMQKGALIGLCYSLALVYFGPQNSIYAQDKMQEILTPPLDNGRIMREFFAGVTGGILGSIGFAYAGAAVIGPHGGEDPGLIGAVIGTLFGATVGSSIGVQIAGTAGDETGSYGATLLGSTVGMLTFLLIHPDPDNAPFWIGLYTLPTVGGIIGFNATRKSQTTSEFGTGLINFRNGQLNLAAPTIYLHRHPSTGRLVQTVDLVRLSF